jgi:hypothetical protein
MVSRKSPFYVEIPTKIVVGKMWKKGAEVLAIIRAGFLSLCTFGGLLNKELVFHYCNGKEEEQRPQRKQVE